MTIKPKIISRETIADTQLFHIEALDLCFANGEERHYERLSSQQQRGAVMIVAMIDFQRALVIKEYAAGFERYLYGLPKGSLDSGEDIIHAANRELKEECGYGAKIIEPLFELSLAPQYMSQRISVVLARQLYPARLVGDEPEPIEVSTIRLDHLEELLMRDDFHEARSIAALYMVRDYLRTMEDYSFQSIIEHDIPLL